MHISYTAAWLKPINKRDDYISQRWSSNKNSLNSLKKLPQWPVWNCWLTSRGYYYGRDRSYFSKQCFKRCQTFRTRRGYVQACFWMHVIFTKENERPSSPPSCQNIQKCRKWQNELEDSFKFHRAELHWGPAAAARSQEAKNKTLLLPWHSSPRGTYTKNSASHLDNEHFKGHLLRSHLQACLGQL